MSDEQVKGVPMLKHLQPEQYASWLRKATDPEWNEEKFGTSTRSKPERAAVSLALELHDAFERIARSEQALAELQTQLAASQARVGELEKALQEALMIIEVGLDTGTFELAGSLADIPARCRAALAAPDGQKEK